MQIKQDAISTTDPIREEAIDAAAHVMKLGDSQRLKLQKWTRIMFEQAMALFKGATTEAEAENAHKRTGVLFRAAFLAKRRLLGGLEQVNRFDRLVRAFETVGLDNVDENGNPLPIPGADPDARTYEHITHVKSWPDTSEFDPLFKD